MLMLELVSIIIVTIGVTGIWTATEKMLKSIKNIEKILERLESKSES